MKAIQEAVGFKPLVDLREGLRHTVRFFEKHSTVKAM